MKRTILITLALLFVRMTTLYGQTNPDKANAVVVTGARFAYPLVQKWIDEYASINPAAKIVIEPRGTTDPSQYDILIDAWEHDEGTKQNREYLYVARYPILTVANRSSDFARRYGEKGLTHGLIKQLFFHDIFADTEDQKAIKEPFSVYTRMQKAGSPATFAAHFGYDQKEIKGDAIAGSDEHLLQAVLRDSTGVTYLPMTTAYDLTAKKPVHGIVILAYDLNGNGRVNGEEKFYESLDIAIQRLESLPPKEARNMPMEYLHLSVSRDGVKPEAFEFLQWIIQNGRNYLHDFGFLQPEPHRFETKTFNHLVLKDR